MTTGSHHLDRFIDVADLDACWPFVGARDKDGYGMYRIPGGRMVRAHRHAYVLATGKLIPAEKFVCHTCDNPSCCNRRHLFVGTALDNHTDMVAKGRRGRPLNAKLTPLDVRAIREVYAARGATQGVIARTFGVSQMTVSLVIRRKTWQSVA